MNIEYVGRNVAVDDALRRYTEDKLAKVLKFLDEPVEVRLTLDLERHRHIADLHVSHRHGVLQATEETAEWRDSINAAVDKVGKQARRGRKRASDKRRRRPSAAGGEATAAPGTPTTG